MSKSVLAPEGFGEKLYFMFPKIYREMDEEVKFALKRYMNTLGEGGFKYVIEDTNRLLTLYDAERVDSDILPYLFKSFGLDIFNGIPELYLRNLLPVLGDLYERKGTKEVIEYLTTVIANVTTSVNLEYGEEKGAVLGKGLLGGMILGVETGETDCVVTLELDYTATDEDFPDKEQLMRIIRKFLPFWCGLVVVYSFTFTDSTRLHGVDSGFLDRLRDTRTEEGGLDIEEVVRTAFSLNDKDKGIIANQNIYNDDRAVFGEALFGSAIFGNYDPATTEVDFYSDIFKSSNTDRSGVEVSDLDGNKVTQENSEVSAESVSDRLLDHLVIGNRTNNSVLGYMTLGVDELGNYGTDILGVRVEEQYEEVIQYVYSERGILRVDEGTDDLKTLETMNGSVLGYMMLGRDILGAKDDVGSIYLSDKEKSGIITNSADSTTIDYGTPTGQTAFLGSMLLGVGVLGDEGVEWHNDVFN